MPVIGWIMPIFTVRGFDCPSTRPGKPERPVTAAATAPFNTSLRFAMFLHSDSNSDLSAQLYTSGGIFLGMTMTKKLRELLARPKPLMAPGAADALTARLIAKHGFEAIYMTGAGTSAVRLGMPDVGLLTMNEMVDNARAI